MHYSIITLLLAATIFACVPPDSSKDKFIGIDYSLEEHRQVRNFQERRATSELLESLKNPDATIRYLAANALASVQDSVAIPELSRLLKSDVSEDVRFQAAYALGQTYHPVAEAVLIESFNFQDTAVINNPVRKAILEAVGKTGTKTNLENIAGVTSYRHSDHHLLHGQALAIYRFALRGIHSQSGTDKMIEFVQTAGITEEARLMAANYLHRTRDIVIDHQIKPLIRTFTNDNNPRIKMALATALGRSGMDTARMVLLEQLSGENDFRVQCNIIRSLSGFNYRSYRDSVITFLSDPNIQVAEVTASLLRGEADLADRQFILAQARQATRPSIKAILYATALKLTPSNFINTRTIIKSELTTLLGQSNDVYDKTYYISALATDPLNFDIIRLEAIDSKNPVLQTAGINALSVLLQSEKFNTTYPTNTTRTGATQNILNAIMSIMTSGNAGAIAAAAGLLRNDSYGFKDLIVIRTPLRQALRNLKLPAELETKYELERTMAFLDDTTYEPGKVKDFKQINWDLLENLSDTSVVEITTSRGSIVLKLLFREAPSSVSNFVDLINQGYYRGKSFHRVVPNFVIQGGCPVGDGYGSLDYTIRSELGPVYYDHAGKLGMASAGKDTEGVQWFITHSPTPHLDGKYSIFGEVVEGMDVVNDIEVGDTIDQISITY